MLGKPGKLLAKAPEQVTALACSTSTQLGEKQSQAPGLQTSEAFPGCPQLLRADTAGGRDTVHS